MAVSEFFVGPHLVPGALQKVVVPLRSLKWQVTGGATGGIGAGTTWRGVDIIESVEITTLITDDNGRAISDLDDALAVWVPFLALVHPAPKSKPPAWDCTHALLVGVWPPLARMAHSKNGIASFRGDDGLSWLGTLVLIEFMPLKQATPAAPDPAKIDNREEGPQDAAERQMQELIDKVNTG